MDSTHASRTLCSLAILALLALSVSQPIGHADYNITLSNGLFRVVWKINAWQNLTGFSGNIFGSTVATVYPANVSALLSGSDLSAFATSLQKAVQAKVGTATIEQPSVQIQSNSPNPCPASVSCPLQWLNITIQFTVRENPPILAGAARYDLSWKAFRLGDGLQAGGVEYNAIGETYLLSALVPFVSFQNALGRSMSVTVGQTPVSSITYKPLTQNIVLLDLSALQTPLANWNVTRDIPSGTQTWTSPSTLGFSILCAFRITESVGGEARLNYYARTQSSAQVSAPLQASVNGDTLSVDTTGNIWQKASFFIILAILATLTSSVVLERRVITKTPTRGKKKRQTNGRQILRLV